MPLIIERVPLFAVLALAVCPVAAAETQPPTQPGLVAVGDAYFPVPEGAVPVELEGGNFETDGQWPKGWVRNRCEVITAADAPEGKSYCRMPATNRSLFRLPADTKGRPGQPHLLSFWTKCTARAWASISFTSQERMRTFGAHYPGLPSTENQWKRVGYYFRMPAMAETIGYSVYLLHLDLPDEFIAFDDVRLRTATDEEMSAAYEAERAKYPEYDISPRSDDGKNLALSVAKWEGKGIPGKPFLIWAVGSSWTNFQGDGYPLIRAVKRRFPQSPPIVYKKHAGSGTPWDYARGWVRRFVVPDQPDLVLTNYVQPGRDNQRVIQGPGTSDVAPHAVTLGENIVPQSWTITMTSDTGDYRLEGTVTGFNTGTSSLTLRVTNNPG